MLCEYILLNFPFKVYSINLFRIHCFENQILHCSENQIGRVNFSVVATWFKPILLVWSQFPIGIPCYYQELKSTRYIDSLKFETVIWYLQPPICKH